MFKRVLTASEYPGYLFCIGLPSRPFLSIPILSRQTLFVNNIFLKKVLTYKIPCCILVSNTEGIYGNRQWTTEFPSGRNVDDYPISSESGGYVRLSAGAGDGAVQRRADQHSGRVAVAGALQAGGWRIYFRPEGACGQAYDPGILSSGAEGR